MDGKVNSRSDLLVKSHEKSSIASQIKNTVKNVISGIKSKITELSYKLKGYIAINVISDSMWDKLRTGDTVAAKKVRRFSRYNVGDIIVFIRDGFKIVHEIINTKYENGEIKYETKGINNLNPDDKLVSKKDIIGKVVMSTKNLNNLLDFVKQGKLTVYDAFGLPDILNERQLKSVQGRLIDELIKLFPTDFFDDRVQVSDAFFSNGKMLSKFLANPKKYVHILRRGIGNLQAKHLKKSINGHTLQNIKNEAKALIKEYNKYMDYHQHHFAEEYTRYFAEQIFGEFFLSDHTFSWLLYFDTHVDLYCPALDLVIEYDGADAHFTDPDQIALDKEKERRCKLRGIDVIRMTKYDDKKQFEQLLSDRYKAITGNPAPYVPHLDPDVVARFIKTHLLPNKYREEHGELSF